VRINNLTLSDGYETGTTLVMETVYNKTFLPILEGALQPKLIKKDPGSPHTPRDSSNSEKNDNRPNNIIAGFTLQHMSALISIPPTTTTILPPPPPPHPTLARRCSSTPSMKT
jgi:hypothetical protein